MGSSPGYLFVFPPFEGKFTKFQTKPIVQVKKLPHKPDVTNVYLVYDDDGNNLQSDGWKWAKGNKSNKSNFTNEKGVSRATKYKCQFDQCSAIKYVDTSIACGVSRIYYENSHKAHKTSPRKYKEIDKDKVTKKPSSLNIQLDNDDFDFQRPKSNWQGFEPEFCFKSILENNRSCKKIAKSTKKRKSEDSIDSNHHTFSAAANNNEKLVIDNSISSGRVHSAQTSERDGGKKLQLQLICCRIYKVIGRY